MKRLFIELTIILIVSLLCSFGVYCLHKYYYSSFDIKSITNLKLDVFINIQDILFDIEKKNKLDNSSQIINNDIENNNLDDVSVDNNTKNNNTNMKEENKKQDIQIEKPKVPINNDSQNVQQKPITPPTPTTEWEKLGMSEEEYNNTPKWSWAKGENYFSAKQYGNLEQAFKACVSAGNEKKKANGGGGFACPDVLGLSDKLIGYYLDYFELKE